MSEKLVLIDGHSILNRAFYGMPDLTSAKGQHTGAVYGFLNIMFKIIQDEQPDYLVVAFDVHAPTFRHNVYKEYKGTRHAMPEELREQVPLMKQVLQAMGVEIREQAGLEADDILGTLAKRAEEGGLEAVIVSGDRDLLQIASDHIKVCIPKTKGGQSTTEMYYPEDVKAAYGVTPREFIDVKALMGDSSDNVPGVPKVGEKTAVSLIQAYGSVDGVYEHLSEITKKALHENLENFEEQARLSLFLVTIKTDADISLDPEKARIGNLYTKEAYELFAALGFKNFLGRFDLTVQSRQNFEEDKKTVFSVIDSYEEARKVPDRLFQSDGSVIGLYPVYDKNDLLPADAPIGAGLSYTGEDGKVYLAYLTVSEQFSRSELCDLLTLFRKKAGENRIIATSALQEQFLFYQMTDEELSEGIFLDGMEDLLLEAYLVNPLKNDYEPQEVILEYTGKTVQGKKELLKKQTFEEFLKEDPENGAKLAEFACTIADGLREARDGVSKKLKEENMWQLFTKIERPVSYILFDMQRIGIRTLPGELQAYGERLTGRIAELEQQIYQDTDCQFNIASPKQLGEILFEKMRLPGGKKTKTGYSTSADVLGKLAQDHPVAEKILEYRALTKLKSTYADGLSAFIAPDRRIHTTFHQTITATGRISSTDPNLQNIPMRTELGRMIRKVFLPSEGCVFMDADYSQIELRILAHMSGDRELIDAYHQNEDIHRITASKVFHVPIEEVTPLQRRNAKAVNFGIVYGQTSFRAFPFPERKRRNILSSTSRPIRAYAVFWTGLSPLLRKRDTRRQCTQDAVRFRSFLPGIL